MINFNFKKEFIKKLTIFLVIFIISMTSFTYIIIENQYDKQLEIIKESNKVKIANINNNLKYKIGEVVKDVNFVKKNIHFKNLNEENKNVLGNLFTDLISSKEYYGKISFLNEDGNEMIRADKFGNGYSYIVSDESLQNKKQRYYFNDSINLKKDEIYISPFDLSMDRGGIKIPYEPTIRFTTNLYSDRNENIGVLVVNYLGNYLLEEINRQDLNLDKNSYYMLINKKGYWLHNRDKNKEWHFMFDNKDEKFEDYYPEIWNEISNKNEAVIKNDKGLFLYKKIYPMHNNWISSTGSYANYEESNNYLKFEDYYWTSVIFIPQSVFENIFNEIKFNTFISNIFLYLLGVLIIVFLSYSLTKNKKYRLTLKKHATFDTMTDLFNRRFAMEILNKEINRFIRNNNPLSILYLDINNLKYVNDNFNHTEGNNLIIDFSKILKNVIRESDYASRLGGDEFLLILPDCDYEGAIKLKKRINKKIKEFNENNNKKYNISVSIGVEEYKKEYGLEKFIQLADDKMYNEKEEFKNS